jgi:hypothetical protein
MSDEFEQSLNEGVDVDNIDEVNDIKVMDGAEIAKKYYKLHKTIIDNLADR